jgi:hypothetical protein
VGNSADSAFIGIGKAPILVRAYRNATQTFTAGTETAVVYNTVDLDNGGNFDTSNGSFVAPVGGVYRARACVRHLVSGFAAGDTADITMKVNGTAWAASKVVSGGSTGFSNCVEDLVVMAAGSTLQTFVNASGVANTRTIVAITKAMTYFSIERVSD